MTTTKMENIRGNPRAILEILDESESESDNESIFSGDSNNMNLRKMQIVMKTVELMVNNQ